MEEMMDDVFAEDDEEKEMAEMEQQIIAEATESISMSATVGQKQQV